MISPTISDSPISPTPSLAVSGLRDGSAVAFRLAQWHSHEPARSRRTEEAPDRICFPTSPDSLGYRLVCAEPDGPALWCAWMLLVGIAGRHARALRGFLVDSSGRPYDVADFALMTGFPAALFERALVFFSNPRLGWLVPAEPEAIPTALREIAETRAARETFEKERAAASAVHREERRRHRARMRLAEKIAAPADRPGFIARLAEEERIALAATLAPRDSGSAFTAPVAGAPLPSAPPPETPAAPAARSATSPHTASPSSPYPHLRPASAPRSSTAPTAAGPRPGSPRA